MNQRKGVTADATTPTLDLIALKNILTMAQRNGRACVRCGGSDYPLKPAGKLLDVDVVECDTHQWERNNADSPARWLTGPCPAWCVDQHRGADHPDDRNHHSGVTKLPLLTMDFENFGSPTEPRFVSVDLMADLVQHYREAEPRVVIDDTTGKFTRYLSLGETQQFAVNLLELVSAGRTGADLVTSSAAGGAAECKPWCTGHDPAVPELCRAADEDVPISEAPDDAYVGLSHTESDGTVIDLDGHLYMTADEAEALVLALLRQIRRVRQTSPA